MRGGDILVLGKQIDILDKEADLLREGFSRKDKKTISIAKHNILIAQKKIKEVLS